MGLSLNAVSGFATFIWPPTGIALAALLLFGYRLWPGIFLAAFLVNVMTGASPLAAIGIGVGNTLEAVIGAFLLRRLIHVEYGLERVDDVLGLIVLAASGSTLISATIGVTSLFVTGTIIPTAYAETWTAWWIGDMLGNLVVAPILLVWSRQPKAAISWKETWEIGIALIVLMGITFVVFGNIVAFGYPFTYLIFLPLIWISLRFSQHVVTSAMLIVSMISIVGTLQGLGPFVTASITNSLLLLQLFIAVGTSISLLLGAIVSERRSTESRLKKRTRELELARTRLSEKLLLIEQINAQQSFEKAKLEAILTNIGDGLIVTDKQGAITIMNTVAENNLGRSLKEVEGKKFVDVFPLEDEKGQAIPQSQRPIPLALSSGKKIKVTYYYKRSDGQRFPADIIVTPFVVASGIVGSIEVFRDMTQEKELERTKDEFISLASHELRTPMTAIKGFLSMIKKGDYGPINEGLQKPLLNISISAERQIRLINDLLDVSRLQTGRTSYHLTDFAFTPVVAEIVESLMPLLKQKNLQVFFPKESTIMVQADVEWSKHIVNNLVSNAIKFTEKGNITITYTEKADLLEIRVSDTGIGIAPSDQEKLFGKFQQLSVQHYSKPVGSGLGLFIAREVARRMGGEVLLEKSEPGKGSTFLFSLPKAGTAYAQQLKAKIDKEKQIALEKK